MIALIVLIPLIAAMVGVAVLKDQSKAKYIAIIGSAVALLLISIVSYNGEVSFPWFGIAGFLPSISIITAPLNFMLLLLVLLVGTLVLAYSSAYMQVPSEQKRFYFQMLAFEAAMTTFSISGSFITLFIAWEFLSLTSYMLIGFWYARDSAIRAARKAITIIFIGDLALLSSIILFWHAFGTLDFTQIISAVSSASSGIGAYAYAGMLLLLFALFTKSAQFPFQEWLTDAMEGPTPVSTYLHSSTMVKAGVFVAILLFPIFSATGTSWIMVAVGIITATIATFGALREMHIKRVLAYSTMQELSIMFIAVGSGALGAAIYFFFAQTFYKALLFFSAGNIIDATGSEYLNETSGLKSNRLIYFTTLFGVLSLAGFIPFSGFFAGEGISAALSSSLLVYAIMSGISLLTSFYIFRWFFYTSRKTTKPNTTSRYETAPKPMVYPMVLLAALTLAASIFLIYETGFIGYGNYIPSLSGVSIPFSVADSVIFLVLIAIGALLSYLTYSKGVIKFSAKKLNAILYTRPITNFVYGIVASFFYEIGEAAGLFDNYVNDIFESIGRLTMHSGLSIRKISVGEINMYALIVALGILTLFLAFYFAVVV